MTTEILTFLEGKRIAGQTEVHIHFDPKYVRGDYRGCRGGVVVLFGGQVVTQADEKINFEDEFFVLPHSQVVIEMRTPE